jgi:transcription initiation factor TFIIF subunit alpha
VPTSKSSAPSKGIPSSSSKTSPTSSAGPFTEEEIRAVLMQETPVTTKDLVANFNARIRSPEV